MERKMDDTGQSPTTATPSSNIASDNGPTWLIDLAGAISDHVSRQNKFKSVYANNFYLEPSAWDLKILFGQLEQHTGSAEVDWHTAVAMPWSQVKVLIYYLRMNMALQEKVDGKICIARRVVPTPPEAPTEEKLKADPNAQELYETYLKIHSEMFG
jgi:hypothetical protein